MPNGAPSRSSRPFCRPAAVRVQAGRSGRPAEHAAGRRGRRADAVAGGRDADPGGLGPQPAPTERPTGGGTLAGGPTPTARRRRPPSRPAGGATGTFTGDAIRTFYGTVQIALQVKNGQIVDVQELQMPQRPAPVGADQPVRGADTARPGADRAERRHQRRFGRQLHLVRLLQVAPVRAGQDGVTALLRGSSVTRSSTSWAPRS